MTLVRIGEHSFDDLTSCWQSNSPASDVAAWQLSQAWKRAEDLVETNPFYARHLGSLPKGRTAADFRSLPVTRKKDVCDDCSAVPPYGSRTTAAASDIRHFVETSGTSGKGREVYALEATPEQMARIEKALQDREEIREKLFSAEDLQAMSETVPTTTPNGA